MTQHQELNPIDRILNKVNTVVFGYDDVAERILYGFVGDGHVLLESVPGLAKTLIAKAISRCIGGSKYARIQMTPNMMPTDITGGRVYNEETRSFSIERGPIFANILLADEINRATPKTQSALLEGMAERHVSLNGESLALPDPFVVLATMNPIEQEGTYPLPEAQLDRFMFKVRMTYVSAEAERQMLRSANLRGRNPLADVQPVVTAEELVTLREHIRNNIYVSDAAIEYITNLVRATRPDCKEFSDLVATKGQNPDLQTYSSSVAVGASPRAEQCFIAAASVRAFHMGRDFVLPDDIKYIAQDVLAHRLILTRQAKANDKTSKVPGQLVATLLANVPVVTAPENYVRPAAA
ncbi:MAG: MoxR family ATPase [Candidatus Obscuribacterales bacterium]|nr:MoxR family ATPase [Candidatus Obscuribacterales bacterium]